MAICSFLTEFDHKLPRIVRVGSKMINEQEEVLNSERDQIPSLPRSVNIFYFMKSGQLAICQLFGHHEFKPREPHTFNISSSSFNVQGGSGEDRRINLVRTAAYYLTTLMETGRFGDRSMAFSRDGKTLISHSTIYAFYCPLTARFRGSVPRWGCSSSEKPITVDRCVY